MIVISFDFGIKNIGVAVGQKYTKTANTLPSIKIKNNKLDKEKFNQLFVEWQPKLIVIGLPLNMDGTKQKITKKTESFSKNLYRNFHIPVLLHDERLSTIEAKSILFEKHGYKSLKKEKIDSMSAVLILESWFSYL